MGDDQHHAAFSNFSSVSREETLQLVIDNYTALTDGQDNWVCNLSNASSLIWHAYRSLPLDINWAGFYVCSPNDPSQLILAPFQGKVACQTIKIGKGVCGTAAAKLETQVVPDVEKFPGHIACDGETKSEIVVPIVDSGKVRGVIDIDCLELGGFSDLDKKYLEKLAEVISRTNKWE